MRSSPITASPISAPRSFLFAAVPPPVLVLGSIASVQVGNSIARRLFDDAGPAGVTLMRLGFSSLLLLALLRPRPWRWPAAGLRAAAVLGLTMGGMNLVFYEAIRTVPLGVAVTVEFVGPLIIVLAQTRRARDVAWAALAATGVVLLGLGTSGDVRLGGLVLALVAGLFWGGYILASASVGRALPGLDGLAVALFVAALVALPFGASGVARAAASPSALAAGLGVAVLSSIVPYSLELAALRRMPTRVFGVLMSLEPAGAAIAGLLVLSQALGPRELVALVLVSVASAGVTLGRREDQVPPQPLVE